MARPNHVADLLNTRDERAQDDGPDLGVVGVNESRAIGGIERSGIERESDTDVVFCSAVSPLGVG